jgi:hypothetical protein
MITTYIGVKKGFQEGNPLGLYYTSIISLVVMALILLFPSERFYKEGKHEYNGLATIFLIAIIIIRGFAIINNIYVIS